MLSFYFYTYIDHLPMLGARFFSPADLFWIPVLLLLTFSLIKKLAGTAENIKYKGVIMRAFSFKMIALISFVLLHEFYFKGGDTNLYYQGVKDMRAAVKEDVQNLGSILSTDRLDLSSPYFNLFYFDGFDQDLTWNYMLSKANYAVPKLALVPSFLVANSFFGLCLFFSLFAFWGSIKLYKVFVYYYPSVYKEIAFGTLFLPSVTFWSSGLLKDSITFGCIGFMLNALFNIFIKKTSYVRSLLIICLTGYLLYVIKSYILLVVVLALSIWLFSELSGVVKNLLLRNLLNYILIVVAITIGFQGVNSITKLESAQAYKVDNLFKSAEAQRGQFENINKQGDKKDSYFSINTSNPIATAFSGYFATFYRPFLWEINTPVASLAFLESTVFLLLTLHFLRSRGLFRMFSIPFLDSRILFCFVLSITFSVAVGISSTNFGALSRYKIPCMSFYFVYLLLLYKKSDLSYPRWFNSLVNFALPRMVLARK